MNYRSRTAFLVLITLLCLTCAAGCTMPRFHDTHNTTVIIRSFNAWALSQGNFSHDIQETMSVIDGHLRVYNLEIAKDKPDYSLLRANLVQDRQLLDIWGSRLDSLSESTGQFEQETGTLSYDNATSGQTHQALANLTQYMKIYTVNMRNAQQHLIEYVENAEAYIGPDDPDYWDDTFRQKAILAKDNATTSLADSSGALENLRSQALQLESLQ